MRKCNILSQQIVFSTECTSQDIKDVLDIISDIVSGKFREATVPSTDLTFGKQPCSRPLAVMLFVKS